MDLAGEAVVVYREPGPGGYRKTRAHGRGDTIRPLLVPDAALEVADILG